MLKILTVNAKNNEKITTLDEKERILTDKDIVITNGEYPVCIAGVMGGLNTDVDENTKSILIESAIFDPISIRYTSNNLNLKSEASIRYGKGLNYEYTKMAMDRACHLLEIYADAKILKDMVIHDKVDKTPKTVSFKSSEINKMLGITISCEDVEKEYNGKLDKIAKARGFENWAELEEYSAQQQLEELGVQDKDAFKNYVNNIIDNNNNK